MGSALSREGAVWNPIRLQVESLWYYPPYRPPCPVSGEVPLTGPSRRFAGWSEPPIRDEEKLWNIVDALVEIGEARGVSAAQIALAWLLERPGISSLVVGGRNEAQFADNFAAAGLRLTDEERRDLHDVSAVPLIYPYWH